MKWNATLFIAVVVVALPNLQAQRGGAGIGRAIVHPGSGTAPGPSSSSHAPQSRWNRRAGAGGYNRYSGYYGNTDYPYYGYSWDYPPYDDRGSGAEPPAPLLTVPQAPEPDSPPPPVPTPVLHEYSWPDSPADSTAAFVIVSKTGIVQHAIAVWVQDGRLCFFTQDGTSLSLLLDDVDREKTTQSNREVKLHLPGWSTALPPANPPKSGMDVFSRSSHIVA